MVRHSLSNHIFNLSCQNCVYLRLIQSLDQDKCKRYHIWKICIFFLHMVPMWWCRHMRKWSTGNPLITVNLQLKVVIYCSFCLTRLKIFWAIKFSNEHSVLTLRFAQDTGTNSSPAICTRTSPQKLVQILNF